MLDQLPPRPCPVCDGTSKRVLYEQRFHSLADGSPVQGYEVVVCTNCGAAFSDRIPEAKVFDDYYERLSRVESAYRGGEDTEFDVDRFSKTADFIAERFTDKSIKIVDIGCGRGGLLHQLRQRGFTNLSGLDPSPGCAQVVDKLYKLKVAVGTITQNPLPKNHFDLMILFGVLEHLPEVKLALKALTENLAEEASILIDVPDATAFHEWPDAPFQEFSIEHINYFAPISLTTLMDSCGFSLTETLRWPLQYTKTTVMPHVKGLYKKRPPGAEPAVGGGFKRDDQSEPALLKYIAQSEQEEKRVAQVLESLAKSGENLVVWGAGTHTLHLLENSALGRCQVVAYIDSNPKLQGQELLGRPILGPQSLKERGETVLISSRVYQDDIAHQIKDELQCANRLILLYKDENN